MGPNVKKLIARKMAVDAIPAKGGFLDGLKFLMDKDRIIESARTSTKWVEDAIAIIKAAPDNKWGDDDEAIAAEILSRLPRSSSQRIADARKR